MALPDILPKQESSRELRKSSSKLLKHEMIADPYLNDVIFKKKHPEPYVWWGKVSDRAAATGFIKV